MEIGRRIREARKARSITLTKLAEQTNLSCGLLSKIERGVTSPSIASLKRIADALEIQVFELFLEQQPKSVGIVRKQERPMIQYREGITHYLLSPDLSRSLEMILVIAQPGCGLSDRLLTHAGEKAGLVLRGRLAYRMEDGEHIIEEGDSFHFDAEIPHTWRNAGEGPLEMILVLPLDKRRPRYT